MIEPVKLGRLPTPAEIRATNFKLARFMKAWPICPVTLDVSMSVPEWPMYANDRLGDCTCAALGHMLEIWTQQVYGQPRIFADGDIIALYDLVNGGGDNGANMGNVLSVFRKIGLADEKAMAYAELTISDMIQVKTGMWLFGGVYVGAGLSRANQSQEVWDVADGRDGEPGSWGGHAINLVQYDENGGTLITWGARKRFTWAWWAKHVDEAYVVIPENYLDMKRLFDNGFDLPALSADLASLPGSVG